MTKNMIAVSVAMLISPLVLHQVVPRNVEDASAILGQWRLVRSEARVKMIPFDAVEITEVYHARSVDRLLSGHLTATAIYERDTTVTPHLYTKANCVDGKVVETRGIYKIEGETLTIAFSPTGIQERPTSFTTSRTSPNSVFVFQREAKE